MFEKALIAGESIQNLVQYCYDARLPLLLYGTHGIGKSEMLKAAAQSMGMNYICVDLSLMEPTDLVGLPYIDDGRRTRFAAPSFLPTDGCGVLAIEEINRAPNYMRTSCLQLLTERRLNDYVVPENWSLVASMNPTGTDYQVDELDPALQSRFVQAHVQADVRQWEKWARESGNIHEKVIEFALQSPGIFDTGGTNPRSLTYLSHLVRAWQENRGSEQMLTIAATGVIGETWALAFRQFFLGGDAPLTVDQVLMEYRKHKRKLASWRSAGKLDLVRASARLVRRFLDSDENLQLAMSDRQIHLNLSDFAADLPADLGKDFRDWLHEQSLGTISF